MRFRFTLPTIVGIPIIQSPSIPESSVWQHEREAVVGAGFHAGEDVGEREALITPARRPFAAPPPDMTGAAFLADACFILEKQSDALVLMRALNTSQQSRAFF